MKFINNSSTLENVDEKKIITKNYNKSGVPIEPNSKDKIFAQQTSIFVKNNEVQDKYLILLFRNVPFDPYGIDSNYENSANLKLKNVSENTFNYYLQYLQTKNLIYMTYAQRSFIDG